MVIVSDSDTCLKATISSSAAAEHQKKTGKRVTEGTLGNIIQLLEAEVVATHLGPRSSRITLLVSKFKVVGSDRSGRFGRPRAFENTQDGQQLLEKLSALRASARSPSRAQKIARQSNEITSPGPRLERIPSQEDGHPGSQQLYSQVPARVDSATAIANPTKKRLTGLRLPQNTSDALSPNRDGKPANRTDALIEMLKSRGTARSMSPDKAQLQDPEPETRHVSPPDKAANDQAVHLPPGAETSCIRASQSEHSTLASSVPMSTASKEIASLANIRPLKVRSRDTKISKDQQKLLDQGDSWLPPEPGRRGPVANVPIAVLQEITRSVEQQEAKRSATEEQEASDQSLRQTQISVQASEPDGADDTDSESLVPSADWPPSSPVPGPRELPPDSSLEIADNSENEKEMHSPRVEDGPVDDDANKSNVESSTISPKDTGASLTRSEGVPSEKLVFIPTQSDTQSANGETETLGLAFKSVPSASIPRSASGSKNRSPVVAENDLMDNDSDLETSVPLKLSEEGVLATGLGSTQEVPATAYEPQKPVLQVKRTPYGGGPKHGGYSQAPQYAVASEGHSSPSKRRRIGDSRAPQRLIPEAYGDHPRPPSPKSNMYAKSSANSGNIDQIRASGIEEIVLVDQIQQEAVHSPGLSASTRSVTYSPSNKQEKTSELEANMPSQAFGDRGHRDLRRKAESPVLSPYVTKRRKVHKSPSAFNFTQEEYPKEDPSITARRHREEFFASRKNSRAMSYTPPHGPRIGKPRSPVSSRRQDSSPIRDSNRLIDERQNTQGPVHAVHHHSPAPSSSKQISSGSNTPQRLRDNEGSLSHEGGASSSMITSVPVAVHSSAPRMTAQMPVVAGTEQTDLLLARSVESDLQTVSTKLEALSSRDVSQQTNRNGPAQILPELITPALSVSEMAPHATPPLMFETTPQAPPAQPEAFTRFKAAYPEYVGTKEHFVGMCKRIRQLSQVDRMEHKSLWDDFIIRHKTDYPQYCQRCMDNAEDAKPYERFYREEVDEPKYTKRIMQPTTLCEVFPIHNSTVDATPSASPVKVDSPGAQVGAHSRLASVPTRRTSFVKSFNQSPGPLLRRPFYEAAAEEAERDRRTPAIQANSPEGPTTNQSHGNVTIDLTGDRSSSPLPAPRALPSGLSCEESVRYSPRKIPRQKSESTVTEPLSDDKRWSQARKDRVSQHSKWNDMPSTSTTTLPSTSKAATARGVLDVQAIPPQSALQGKSQQTQLEMDAPVRVTGREVAAATRGSKAQSKQQEVELDEWWKDDNTPFREYTRLYQSITPGRGNAWAIEKGREESEGKEEGKGKKKGNGKQAETKRATSLAMGIMDVMSWRL